jgi:hypothetical protein
MELEGRYGNRWRRGRRDELQFYSLRREIVKQIERVAYSDGISEAVAIQHVQGLQDREKWSLDKLCKRLRQEARSRRRAATEYGLLTLWTATPPASLLPKFVYIDLIGSLQCSSLLKAI